MSREALGSSATPIPTEKADGPACQWRTMAQRPDAPCMAVLATISPVTVHLSAIAPGRDERYEIGWWTGSMWAESGTGHTLDDRRCSDGPDWMPTHWLPFAAPVPASQVGMSEANAQKPPDTGGEVERLRAALKPLLAMFDDYQASDLNHECAHRAFVGWQAKFDAWNEARAALEASQ